MPTYKHPGDSKTRYRRTQTPILQNLTLTKTDNANATDEVLQTQLTRNFADKSHADFESLQNRLRTLPKKPTQPFKTNADQNLTQKP
jgi:hypothetical protein